MVSYLFFIFRKHVFHIVICGVCAPSPYLKWLAGQICWVVIDLSHHSLAIHNKECAVYGNVPLDNMVISELYYV